MFHFSKSKHVNFVKLHELAEKMTDGIFLSKKQRRLRRIYKILKICGWSIAVLFLILLTIFSVKILGFIKVYDQAILGKANLEKAIILSQQDKLSQARSTAVIAENNFTASINRLDKIKNDYIVNKFSLAVNQLNDIESLLTAAQFLSRAVNGGASFGLSMENLLVGDKKLNFSKFSPEEKHKVLGKLFESAPELNGIKADLDLAYLNLEQAGPTGVLFPFKGKINQIKNQIYSAGQILEKAIPLTQILPALAGYPNQAAFLVMLENSDELRPTGGFLGTYGILKIKDGEITDFTSHDIYHLDMPVKDKLNITPPEPIKKYLVPKWYLRDANWSPDWPTAAQKISWFYQTESRLNPAAETTADFNGVIALTPKLIIDFLKIIGPVAVEGQSYDQTNFQDLLEYRVEKGYVELGVSSWQRKEVISQIAKEIKIKIFDLPPAGWSKVMAAAIDNLAAKNLMLYLTDNHLESIALANGWGGEIKNVAQDYLMVVDANLGALKTDSVMDRGLSYEVKPGSGGLTGKLTIDYTNHGKADWRTGTYKSYTRVYVPLGSQLIDVSGYKADQIDVGQESGKTWFGFFLTVDPGKTKTLTVDYKLPDLIKATGKYALYLQKQPGKEYSGVKVDLSFLNEIKSYNADYASMIKISPTKIGWNGDLNVDRSFQIELK